MTLPLKLAGGSHAQAVLGGANPAGSADYTYVPRGKRQQLQILGSCTRSFWKEIQRAFIIIYFDNWSMAYRMGDFTVDLESSGRVHSRLALE